ncbi:MAG TPA: DUF2231 domain-containing protein [Solirubrobacteraceae bacterium]|jgi:hypothetical protein|nr:DUF2231 domain-containing protein [Solirubrobacteraceae bacterium]
MSTPSSSSQSGRVDWRRAEFILTGLAFLGFITIGIRMRTIYGGLPAHPLFIHVPVVLIPLSVLGALACIARPHWFDRYGVLLCLCSIVAMSSIFLAMEAGAALESALALTPAQSHLISEHSHAAHILAIAFVLFTACLILTFSAHRISGGRPTGLGIADAILGERATYLALRVGLVVLALFCAFFVYRVGDLGAKAVWLGRLHAG